MSRSGTLVRSLRVSVSVAMVVALASGALGPGWAQPGLAQEACTPETEPNDTGEQAPVFEASGCVQGALPDGDPADLWLWTIDPVAAGQAWNFRLSGLPGTITGAQLVPISSEPGATPMTYLGKTFELDAPADATGPVVADGVLLPAGRYVLAVARTGQVTDVLRTSDDYELSISRAPLPPLGDAEPNDDATLAAQVPGAFALSGDITGSADLYTWSRSGADAEQTWDLALASAPGSGMTLSLLAPDGRTRASVPVDSTGSAVLRDLRPGSGSTTLQLLGGSGPYVLRATPSLETDVDPEPDGDPRDAVPLAPGTLVSGRLSAGDDRDLYRLHLDGDDAARLLDVRVVWRGGPDRQVCLFAAGEDGAQGPTLQCSPGTDGVAALRGLLLPEGDALLEVSGPPDDARYRLRVDTTSPPAPDFEAEPNGDPRSASPVDPETGISGRFVHGDLDHLRVPITGEAQRWRVDVRGTGIEGLAVIQTDGAIRAQGELSPDQAVLTDLYLVPGDHWLRLSGSDGAYHLTMTALGPPRRGEELEPNDDEPHSETLALEGSRDGRLPLAPDVDVYRFSLAARERVRIDMDPPDDGAMAWYLTRDATPLASDRDPAIGERATWAGELEGGDYVLRLASGRPSEGWYRVALTREDPFEPGPPLPAQLEIKLEADTVAAWWPDGQAVKGTVRITAADEPLEVSLDARTSDAGWSATFDGVTANVEAGASVDVPLSLRIAPDAVADVPVAVTVRARDTAERQRTATATLTPSRDATPVGPFQAWSVPETLLGGLDVAASALGAAPVPSLDAAVEARLHDGLAYPGGGVEARIDALPITFTMDLAGDASIPVAGTLLDPLAGATTFAGVVKDFTILLSDDGTTWLPALSGELSPMGIEQAFVLPAPVPARFAQLRVDSTWGGDVGEVALGEWKVIAQPLADVVPNAGSPAADLRNVADPALGGHVVWMSPQSLDQTFGANLLSADPLRLTLVVPEGTRPTWVVGFRDDRAVQLERLEWVDPAGSDPATRMSRVTVEASATGPLGPWTDLGIWRLKRSADGSVTPFSLPSGTWARFLRFTGDPARSLGQVEEPGTIRAIEVPQSAGYRSILGEWGGGPAGPAEWQRPTLTTIVADEPDAGDAPATATPLAMDTRIDGRVHIGQDEDWYAMTVPDGQRRLTVMLDGAPTLRARPRLLAADGTDVPMRRDPGGGATTVTYVAGVEPGSDYLLGIEQPPYSAAVTFDTSGSLGAYLSVLPQALRAYAAGVVPGQEQVRVTPFAEEPLLAHWTDDAYELSNAAATYVPGWDVSGVSDSSALEDGMLDALSGLAVREGGRAILVATDAETTSYARNELMWRTLDAVGPQVFSLLIAGTGAPLADRQTMQDLARVGGGWFTAARSHADVDQAFDRLATWLRRPAGYSLLVTTSPLPVTPPASGSLAVVSPLGPDGSRGSTAIASDVAVELVLDTSGSMLKRFGRRSRIAVAREVLAGLVRDDLPAGIPVAFRTFTPAPDSCDTELVVPLGPLDPTALGGTITGMKVVRTVRTPLAAAISAVAEDLVAVTGPRIVVVLTDGKESCGGDPVAAVRELLAAAPGMTFSVVGLGIDRAARRAISSIAAAGGGSYFDARDPDTLRRSLAQAFSAPYQVLDGSGAVAASGTVDGPAVALSPGTFQVVVRTDPPVTFGAVVVEEGGSLRLTLPVGG